MVQVDFKPRPSQLHHGTLNHLTTLPIYHASGWVGLTQCYRIYTANIFYA